MVFLTLRAAWLRRQRAKKELTTAKNNAKVANKQYNAAKKAAISPVKSLPPRSSNNRGVMRMVHIKRGNNIEPAGVNNNGYNELKRTHKYVPGGNGRGYWVRK